QLIMEYYAGTHNAEKLIPAAMDYVNNGLFKQDIKGMIAADKADFEKSREPFLSGTKDSTQVENWEMLQRLGEHQRMLSKSYSLRNAAEAIYENVEDKEVLKQAAAWAKKADSWFPHFSSKAVYAGLLLKCGRKQKALEMMAKASKDDIIKGSDRQKLLLENTEKIKNGVAPEDLW